MECFLSRHEGLNSILNTQLKSPEQMHECDSYVEETERSIKINLISLRFYLRCLSQWQKSCITTLPNRQVYVYQTFNISVLPVAFATVILLGLE